MTKVRKFKVNQFLSLKLENGKTHLYVNGEKFRQCKYLLLSVPFESTEDYGEINSIDEAAESLDQSMEGNYDTSQNKISPNTEFWGHCSNIQAWAENRYDTRLLHSNLAFPLLKRLTEVGDPRAKRVFKEEVARRIQENVPAVTKYLIKEGYVDYLNDNELEAIEVDWVELNDQKIIVPDNTLDLSHSGIAKLSEVERLNTLNSLEHLNLGWTRLETLPKSIRALKSLNTLNLAYNKMKALPKSIGDLKKLRMVNLAYNMFIELPKSLGNLNSLRILDLRSNDFRRVPEGIINTTSLEKLNLSKNRLTSLPESIGNLTSLKELYLHQNNLHSLPKAIENLTSLEVLHLGHNRFDSLPKAIFKLPNLTYLNIWFNPLTEKEYPLLEGLEGKGIEVRSLFHQYENF
jgi:hypothetical protein